MPEGLVDTVLVRMDKIGDLVLSMASDQHPAVRGGRTHWFVTRGLGLIAERAEPRRRATEFTRAFSFREFVRMVRWLKHHQPRTIILLHNPWWVSAAAWWAGVPERIGRLSQWHSFLFLNLGVRQKRSRADRHESDFNFDLIEQGTQAAGLRKTAILAPIKNTFLKLTGPDPGPTLAAHGLRAGEYYVVHPGMFGSALNWPPDRYIELIASLAERAVVVITGTKIDQAYLADVAVVRLNTRVRWLVEELTMPQLLDVLAAARAVIAPSTGVVHLAASLGTPTVGIYSPRTVEHPRRWGPRGPRATYVMPPAQEVEMINPEVMREVSVGDVREAMVRVERAPNPEPPI